MALDVPLLVPAIRLDRDDGSEEATALRRATEPWLAGFLLFGGEAEQVAALTKRLREAAGRPIFIASDMERGAGQQVAGLTRLPDAGLVGIAGRPWDAMMLGELTATEARSVGIDVIFAPCADVRSALDNPILGNRSFGFDPARVADLAMAFADGVVSGGGLPVVKHFPGHGATTQDSHDAIPVVDEAATVLEQRDLFPFDRVLGLGACPALMTAHVAYPTLDATGVIATFSKPILDRARSLVRSDADHRLVVFTDALLMAGAATPGGEAEAARRSLAAGCDALLYPEDPEPVAAALTVGEGFDAGDLARAHRNVAAFAERAASMKPAELGLDDPVALADRVAFLALDMTSNFVPLGDVDAVHIIDDDDIEDRGAELKRIAEGCDVPCELTRLPRGERPSLDLLTPGEDDDFERSIIVFASARAWKGTAGVSPLCREVVAEFRAALEAQDEYVRVLWCTPRAENANDAHVPGSGPQLERAIAARTFGGEPYPEMDLFD